MLVLGTQDIRLGSKSLYPQSHLVSHRLNFRSVGDESTIYDPQTRRTNYTAATRHFKAKSLVLAYFLQQLGALFKGAGQLQQQSRLV